MDQRFAYDGWREVEDLVPEAVGESTQAVAERVFVWGGELDELLAYQRKESGNWVSYYPLQNHQRSVVKLLDSQGNLVENVEYDPYGKATVYIGGQPQASSSVENPYLYQGRRVDPETGFVYMRNRYYHTDFGRWLSVDPGGMWADPTTLGNGYAFGPNAPTVGGDPTGGGWIKRLRALFKIAKLKRKLSKLKTLKKQLEDGIKSHKKQIAKHKEKIREYLADPDAHDHKGELARCKTPAERERRIKGRKEFLEKTIKKHENEIKKKEAEIADLDKQITDILSQLNVLGVAGMIVAPATTAVAQEGGGVTDYVGAGLRDAVGLVDPGVIDVIEWMAGG